MTFFPEEDFTTDEYKIIHRFLLTEFKRINQTLAENPYSKGTYITKDNFMRGLLEMAERNAKLDCHPVTSE